MLSFTQMQWQTWLAQYWWVFVRIGGCLMVAPMFGARTVPRRIRLGLALALAIMVAPLVAVPTQVEVFSGTGLVITVQQLLIGIALGFAVQLVFDALAFGGQLLADSIGLSFAASVDPLHGVSTPVVGQWYLILMTLTFLSLNGHVLMIESLVQSFSLLPVGINGLGSEGLWQVALLGNKVFAGALMVALPSMAAALIVNMAFGVMSRAAPSMNLFGVGFPAILAFGLAILVVTLPGVQAQFLRMANAVWLDVNVLLRAAQ